MTVNNNYDNVKYHFFHRLRFKKSTHLKTGNDCYIGKVLESYNTTDAYDPNENKNVALAIESDVYDCPITREGRWDVVCKKMKHGKGYMVDEATYSVDELTISEGDDYVSILLNGGNDKIITSDYRDYFTFFCSDYYSPDKIIIKLKRNLKFIQISPDFDFNSFCDLFVTKCNEKYANY